MFIVVGFGTVWLTSRNEWMRSELNVAGAGLVKTYQLKSEIRQLVEFYRIYRLKVMIR